MNSPPLFSFSFSLLFFKLLRTEPVGVKSSFTSDIFLSVFILYSLRDVFIHSQINIIKALALAWLVAPMQFMGLMKINVGQKPHITAIFMGLNQNCHKVKHGINPGFTKSKMKKISSPWCWVLFKSTNSGVGERVLGRLLVIRHSCVLEPWTQEYFF